MKRKLVYVGAAWGTGLLCGSFVDSVLVFLFLPAILIFLLVFRFVFKGRFKEFILIISAFAFALGFYKAYDSFVYRKVTGFAGERINFSGRISSLTDYSKDTSRYVLSGRINGGAKAKILVYTDTLDCEPGDIIELEGTLELPENTYLFNAKDYYKSCGIFIETDEIYEISFKKSSGFSAARLIGLYREKAVSFIKSNLPERESGFLISMLFADKSGLDENDSDVLYGIGIGHILAVSGLHLMLFCGMIRRLIKRFILCRGLEFAVTEAAMLLFALCCGMPLSVIRTFIMLTISNSAPLLFRRSDTLNSICIALILMTLPCPFYITSPSLVLSVAGTWGAGVFAPFVTEKLSADTVPKKFGRHAAFLTCVYAAVFPASVLYFGESSLISPVTNMLLTPVCMAALVIAMVSVMFVFVNPVWAIKASGILCKIILEISERIYKINFLRISFGDTACKYLLLILVILCFAAYFVHRSRKYSVISVMVSAAVFMSFASYLNFSTAKLMSIAMLGENMGAVVISKGNTADIIDISGERRNGDYVEKYLAERNINKINNVFICKKPYNISSVYNYSLRNSDVGNICLPEGYDLRDDMKICGCVPAYSDYSCAAVRYESYGFRIENGFVYAENGDFSCVLTGGKGVISEFETNTALLCDENGKVKVKHL
ncbi:MAG: ComEC/Rec2 family competence protein [Porcipelethomonas sp.]